MKLISVVIGGKKFGFPIGLIREILANFELTHVDRVDEDILGLMNVRGQIVSVLNPRVSLNLKNEAVNPKIIVVKKENELTQDEKSKFGQNGTSDDFYAFHVDDVDEVSEVLESDLCPIPGNTPKEEAQYLTMIARVNDDLLPVLNVHKLIHLDTLEEAGA
jgi:purine-binding chemotaxis protein CheW